MSARDKHPAETPQEIADRHDMRIHRAKQLARRIEYVGAYHFIAGFCWHKGDAEMVVYLEGRPEPVRPCDITILEQPHD